jgi:hypothetical protein
MNLLALFLALFALPQSLVTASVSLQVFHGTAAFHGFVALYEVIDAQHANRISATDLDVDGKATIPVSLDKAKLYRVDIVNDSHKPPCPCMRATHGIDPSILPAGDAGNVSLRVNMDGIADSVTGLYSSITVVPQ